MALFNHSNRGYIHTISLSLPIRMGRVNCYLVQVDSGYILIDTGSSNKRAELDRTLESVGCGIGDLRLIILTHGDFDHSGNAAHLRDRFETKVAMHHDDSGMVEKGDMFWNRKKGVTQRIIGSLVPLFTGFSSMERLRPDLPLDDGDNLSDHGSNATVISVPGHSKGSIAILTKTGDLFCGDLFTNIKKPVLNSIINDREAALSSVEKLKDMNITKVYPGHGAPFRIESLDEEI